MTALTAEGMAPYRDPTLPLEERVEDLLARMTWDEKASQLGSVWVFQLLESDAFAPGKAAEHLRSGIGHITRVSGASNLDSMEAAEVANSIQAFLANETRLGIPAIVHEEICSGLMAARVDGVPPSNRCREHLGACPRRGDGRLGSRPDASHGGPSRPLPGARHRSRPTLGPPRGDLRRGPASGGQYGNGLRARPPGTRSEARSDRHGEAFRRLQRLGRGAELGAGPDPRSRAAGGIPPPLRRCGESRAPLGDERLPRAGRRSVRGRSGPAHRAPQGDMGVRGISGVRLLLGSPARELSPPRR